MRWQGREQSDNIEDRRGMRVPGGRGTGFGCIGILVVMVIALLTGADPRQLLGLLGVVEQLAPPQAQQQQVPEGLPPADDPQAQFISVVLKDTENAWNAIFQKTGGRYQEPTLVLLNWEGDLYFDIQPDDRLSRNVSMYLDLWHGKCMGVTFDTPLNPQRRPRFVLTSSYGNFTAVLLGQMNPMTAMMTSKLKVDGDLGYMMRHVPAVLDFVRCAREITTDVF